MQQKNKYNWNRLIDFCIIVIMLSSISFSCKTSKQNARDCHTFGKFSLCDKNSTKLDLHGIDGQAGEITGSNYKLTYDYSPFASNGPIDINEYFHNTFRSMYYLKFFDSIYIDKKVQKIYRDSVKVLSLKEVVPGTNKRCFNCNYEAVLKFRTQVQPFYFFISADLYKELHEAQIEHLVVNNHKIKFYQGPEISGAFIQELNVEKQGNKLNLQLISGDFEKFKSLVLKSLN